MSKYFISAILYWAAHYTEELKLYFNLRFNGQFYETNEAIAYDIFQDARHCDFPIICLN